MLALRLTVLLLLVLLPAGCERAERVSYGVEGGQWRSYGADPANTKYSPLDQIDAGNFGDLEVVWTSDSPDVAWRAAGRRTKKTRELNVAKSARILEFQATSLMVDGTLYTISAVGQVFAVDASSGALRWVYDPASSRTAESPMDYIFPKHRGVAYWRSGDDERVLVPTIDSYLLALDAKTGQPIPSFGEKGRIDLTRGLRGPEIRRLKDYFQSSPPVIVGDTVVVGSSVTDRPKHKHGTPGDVRGYDVESGQQKWVFHVVPSDGEFGTETWQGKSWKYSGGANVWGPMSADPELGYVYVATSAPTNDYYGGHRKGDNLFAGSLLCLDAETGKRIWHQQLVRHDLWDYDLAAAPNLVDLEIDGKLINAVAQVSKQGFVFVFDRITGEPIWPIREQPAPASDVPGEQVAATQRVPSKPPPFERQGTYEDGLIDFTPELRAEALEVFRQYRTGPMFTPPSLAGSLVLPGPPGGTNWQGAAFDPETATLFVPSITHAQVVSVKKGKKKDTDFDYVTDLSATRWIAGPPDPQEALPLFKPPYSRITAYDLPRGQILWQEANGEGPRDHPRLAGLNLPRLGSGAHACVLATRTLLLSADRSSIWMGGMGEPVLRAYRKDTGALVGEIDLPARARGCPTTYVSGGRQFIVLPIGDEDVSPRLLALSLAEPGLENRPEG